MLTPILFVFFVGMFWTVAYGTTNSLAATSGIATPNVRILIAAYA
jgi:hypothetical protein